MKKTICILSAIIAFGSLSIQSCKDNDGSFGDFSSNIENSSNGNIKTLGSNIIEPEILKGTYNHKYLSQASEMQLKYNNNLEKCYYFELTTNPSGCILVNYFKNMGWVLAINIARLSSGKTGSLAYEAKITNFIPNYTYSTTEKGLKITVKTGSSLTDNITLKLE